MRENGELSLTRWNIIPNTTLGLDLFDQHPIYQLLGMHAGGLAPKAPSTPSRVASIVEIKRGRWPEAVPKTALVPLRAMTSARIDSRTNPRVFLIFGRKVGAGLME
jgi:hypothetical protein